MSWSSNWQQDLTPVEHDSSSSHLYNPDPDNMNGSYFDEEPITNMTLEQCTALYSNETILLSKVYPDGFCREIFDSILCWPPTPKNKTASVKCFSELFKIKYDDTQNSTRDCLPNGTWAPPDYFNCREIIPEEYDTQVYYFVGYTLSLVTLLIAIGIFTYFKELQCLRNTIHLNLMWSHLLTHFMWILTLILLQHGGNASIVCLFDITLLHYFYVTTFFWMFVEGLYLYILVVKTLTRESFKLRVYVCIGWGIPLLVIVIWAVAKSLIRINNDPSISCQWFEYHAMDWIFLFPTVVVLLLNMAFLFSIMCVLITKLRSATTVETQQYHKAAKALLVLIPLLGITYVITIYSPAPNSSFTLTFESIRAILLSTQGFIVALFYCFLNTEVQNTVRHHFENWKANRTLGSNRLRSTSRSKDASR